MPENAFELIDRLIEAAAAEGFRGLADQLSNQRLSMYRSRLLSLKALLAAFEELYRDPLLMLHRILIFCTLEGRIKRLVANNAEQIGADLRQAANRVRTGEGQPTLTLRVTEDAALTLVVLSDLPLEDEQITYLSGDLTLRALRETNRDQQISIAGVTPNWLFAPAPIPIGSGGPGARPVPPLQTGGISRSDVEIEVDTASAAQALHLSAEQIGQIPARRVPCDDSVSFLILDTVPSLAQLRRALKQYGETNELMAELLAGLQAGANQSPARSQRLSSIRYFDTRLDPHFDECSAPSRPQDSPKHPGDIVLADHDYDMSDHGVFIAGLVAANTDESVQIHLIEALNRCGIGTVYSLLWALQEAQDLIRQNPRLPVVINLSLMLSLPLRSQHQVRDDPAYVHQMLLYCEAISLEPGIKKSTEDICTTAIKSIIDHLQTSETETVIIAAAGNDGEKARGRVPARVPAAFASVTGVGALDQQMQMTVYSNEADEPLSAGFDILGGELDSAVTTHNMADAAKGVLSVYTASHFPAESHNPGGSAQ